MTDRNRAIQVIAELNEEIRRQSEWAIELDRRIAGEVKQREEAVRLLDIAETTVIERTDWAKRLDAQLQDTMAQLEMVRQSRWLKLGRQLGLGPRVKEAAAKEGT
jgi:aspartyl/asparaginyl-tRNA synthetase